MADELLDQVDKDDNVIGTVWKSEAHNNSKVIHREVGIAVFNDEGEILLQQRSFKKINGPGMWDISSVGHVVAGEDPKIGIKRELLEELGIEVQPIYFDKFFSTYSRVGESNESRFTWVYYSVIHGRPKTSLQLEEVNDVKWVKFKLIRAFARNNDFRLDRDLIKMTFSIAKKLKIV